MTKDVCSASPLDCDVMRPDVTGRHSNQLPNGLTLVQQNTDCAVDLTGGRTHGWLFVRGPDGQWVTHRKLEGWEITQAEDQRDCGIVQQGTKVRGA